MSRFQGLALMVLSAWGFKPQMESASVITVTADLAPMFNAGWHKLFLPAETTRRVEIYSTADNAPSTRAVH